jgi:hypothetical protein
MQRALQQQVMGRTMALLPQHQMIMQTVALCNENNVFSNTFIDFFHKAVMLHDCPLPSHEDVGSCVAKATNPMESNTRLVRIVIPTLVVFTTADLKRR